MTAKTRQQIERILSGAAGAARSATGAKICGAYAMDTPETVYFVTVGGDDTGITPRQLGAAIEKVGVHLQGRTDGETHVEMVNRSQAGNTEPLDLDKPFSPHSEDQEKAGKPVAITGMQLVALLKLTETMGRSMGRALAYRDVLDSAEKRMHGQEEALKRARPGGTEESMCMGEIMALKCLLDAFDGAVDHYMQEGAEALKLVSRYVVGEGITGAEQAADALKTAGL